MSDRPLRNEISVAEPNEGDTTDRVRVELTRQMGSSSVTYSAEDVTREAAIETLLALVDADEELSEE